MAGVYTIGRIRFSTCPPPDVPAETPPPGSPPRRAGCARSATGSARPTDAPLDEARRALCELPGVGRKTAACVLLFSYGRDDVPVDTHVYRVGSRLGLFRPGASFDEAHDELLRLTDPGDAYEIHVGLIRHGRRTCTSRAPRCRECPLLDLCPYGRAVTARS